MHEVDLHRLQGAWHVSQGLCRSRTGGRRSPRARLQGHEDESTGLAIVWPLPFHEEKTPSFAVDPVRGVFHCFGCGAGGDAISFYRRLTGATFHEALQELAERYQVAPLLQGFSSRPAAELLSALDAAAGYYAECLEQQEGKAARDYLNRRRVPQEIREAYRLGFSPPDGSRLQRALGTQFGNEVLVASGLVRRASSDRQDPLDLFRNRIVFPITDEAGQVLGFGGRLLGGDGRGPKYLNGPNTPVFSKSRSFFGLSQALSVLRRSRRVLLVEGYFDVLAMSAASAGPALGIMSTSLHAEQIRRLARLVQKVVLLLDGDQAGRKAAAAMAPVLLRAEMTVLQSFLPEGLDPAGLREAQGDSALQAVCDAAEDIVLGSLRVLGETRELSEEIAAIRSLLQLVRSVPDGARRLAYARRVASGLGLPPEGLLELALR